MAHGRLKVVAGKSLASFAIFNKGKEKEIK
jgi:hypothetical protein